MFLDGLLSLFTNPKVNPLSALVKSLGTLSTDGAPGLGILSEMFKPQTPPVPPANPQAPKQPIPPQAQQAQPGLMNTIMNPQAMAPQGQSMGMPQPGGQPQPPMQAPPMLQPVQIGGAQPGNVSQMPPVSNPVIAPPPPNLGDDKQAMLNSLKGVAGQTFPQNPVLQQVALAQALQESGLMGKESALARMNNLFGIKAPGNAGTINMGTDEYINGAKTHEPAKFGINTSVADSFNQYKNTLNKSRYQSVINASDPLTAFRELQKAGYATDPHYADNLARVYRQYVLPLYK